MSNQRGVGSFCSIVVSTYTGASDSLAALSGFNLGEGAEAFCLQNRKTYRYTNFVIAPAPPLFVAAQGTGTWIEQDAVADTCVGVVGTTNFINSATALTGLRWQALPSAATAYGVSISGVCWSLNSTTGVLTYSGESGHFYLVTGIFTWQASLSTSPVTMEIDISQNGSLLGTSTDSLTRSSAFGSNALIAQVVSTVYVGANFGDVFQHVWRATSQGYTFTNYQATFNLLP